MSDAEKTSGSESFGMDRPGNEKEADKATNEDPDPAKARDKIFEEFWDNLESQIRVTIPADLRPMLNKLGCANDLALRNLTEDHISKLEEFAKKHLSKRVTTPEEKAAVFGLFSDDPTAFEFVPGHRMLLEAIGEKMKERQHMPTTKRPPEPRPKGAQDSAKRLKASNALQTQDSEEALEDPVDNALKSEEACLKRLLTSGLLKECSVAMDPDKAPLFTVSLDSMKEGKVACHMGECTKVLRLTRTNLRTWGKQNYYRHVREQHGLKDTDTRQRCLTALGVTVTTSSGEKRLDEEAVDDEGLEKTNGQSAVSRWKHSKYSRSERAKRQLEIAALDSCKITQFWPLITRLESVIRENECLHRTVRVLLQRIADHNATKLLSKIPGISPFLQALISSALKNMDRKKGGERYERELLLIAAHFFMVAGRKAYTDLHLNLQKIIPSTSSVIRMIDKSKFIPRPGDFAFQRLSDFLNARRLPRVVNVAIDGTRCVARIQYDPSSNQLVGFVPKLAEGVPVLAPFPATSEHVIRRYFDTETPGSIMTCVMVRPLARGAPSFCLCAYPTDNKFSASEVSSLLIHIEIGASKFGIRIAAHGSDGDTRFLSAMQLRMFPACDNSLAWRWWFRSRLTIKVPCVQDSIHIGTKLRNLMLRDNGLCMGNFIVSTSHVRFLVQEVSKDQHELTSSDIDPKDRMNYRSMERLCSPKVVELLREKVPDSEGTCVFLEMARDVIDAFVDRSLVPSERIFKIWRAVFFYRAWRQWVKQHPSHTLQNSFLTGNAYTCVEINAHALVLLVRYHRDHAGEENLGDFMTWVLGSQDCEAEFKLLRSMTSTFSTVINFTPLEFLHRISRAGLEQDIRQELGHKYRFSENRRAAQRENTEYFPDQESLPTDREIFQIIDHAKLDARFNLENLGMLVDIPDVFSSFAEVELDGDDEQSVESEPDEPESVDPTECQEAADEDQLDCCEDIAMAPIFTGEVGLRTFNSAEVTPDSPFVKVTDFYGNRSIVKKSSLVWMLSHRESVSNDRNLRFQMPQPPQSLQSAGAQSWRAPTYEEYVHLGDWCVCKERGDLILVGRVLGFRYLSGKNSKYTLRSAPTTPPLGVTPRGLGILAHWYQLDEFGEMERIASKTYVSMDSYKWTVSRPKVLDAEMTLDLRTVRHLNSV